MTETTINEQEASLTFEEAMKRLEEIAGLLEGDASTLDEALKLYEEGISLIRDCSSKLDAAEQRVKMLQMQPTGEVAAVDFAGGED
jgi:exodeoxyribonuclease VII small subunit